MALRDFIRDELKERDGKTILIATHDLREAEAVSDRVAIMVAGRVRAIGPVEEIRRWGLDERFYAIELKGQGSLAEGKMKIHEQRKAGDRIHLRISVDHGEPLNGVLRSFLDSGYELIAFSEYESDLEEAFTRILRADREDAASDDANGKAGA